MHDFSLTLSFSPQRNVVNEAREYYKETGDIDGTLRQLPRYLVAERAIVSIQLLMC